MIFGGLEKFTLIDYPGKVACMVYTIGCNFRCPYCHNPELVDETVERIWTEKEILSFLKKRKGILDGLVITGGEPTMHKDLPVFIKKVKKLGFAVKLDSNGTNPEMFRRLIKDHLIDYAAMDIKSPLFKYSQTVSHPVDVRAIRKSIHLLMTSSIPYEFRTTLVKVLVTPQDLEKIGKEIRGARQYYLQKFIPTKILNPQFLRKTTYSDRELKVLQKKLSKYVQYCGIR
ncbi:MAG: anaerobic ribonucleoside-triphosphate reductase activating protein [Patescibacteria group bacterium]